MRKSNSQLRFRVILAFIILIASIKVGISQVIPTGLTLKINGELEITLDNYRFNITSIKDSVLVTSGTYQRWMDILEVESEILSIIETPDPDWTSWSVLEEELNPSSDEYLNSMPVADWSLYDSTLETNQTETQSSAYEDVFEYHGTLTDAQKKEIHDTLDAYALKHSEKDLVMKDWYAVQEFLSVEDTIINKELVYDYLIDKVIFYTYDDGKLVGSIGYFHSSAGIEIDTLKYDSSGKLIFFSKESIGISHDSYYFYYNENNQVIEIKHVDYSYHSSLYENCPSCKQYSTYEFKFSYNAQGKINSMKHLSYGKWYERTFEYPE